ncbi:hypothetical protein [Qipengyuania sediminis]|uniref:hypothetical protein n=1 Tax=Qipengyuania sediminis TaxID=1532023 RepID=UPI001059BC5C|nr:hypothetical protein [Qipengyuania sediminis]
MNVATPQLSQWKKADWRATSHSAQAAARYCRAITYSRDFDLEIAAPHDVERLLPAEPTLRFSYDTVRALLDGRDTEIFEQGSFRYSAEIKPLRDAFLDEFQFALSIQMGGSFARGRVTVAHELTHIALSRRSVGRALDELLDIFRNDALLGAEPIVRWFRTRVREVIARVTLTVRFRDGSDANAPPFVLTLREWARLFAIHTGFSPPAKRIADSDPLHGGDNDSNRRPDACQHSHARRRPQHLVGPGIGRVLESMPAACGKKLVHDRRIHGSSATPRRPFRRADRRHLGYQLRLGLRPQPGFRTPVGATAR